jgi:uncharacterized protein YhaN
MAMEIEGWAIDAFGALSDVEHRGVNSGLSVIYGPNEAGKSTLRHFVLGVLFGFSPSTGRDLPYSPSSGGFRSGRLFLRNDDEELTITRVEQRNARGGVVTLLGADGTARADAELAALLGGLNRQVYNRIFAVGLDELNDLAALTDGDLQDHLLSAGVTGAGRIATQARNKLRIRAEELHKPRAQSTKVSSLREQLRAIDEELRNAQRAAAELTDRRQDLVDSRANVDDLATRERAALAKAARARRLGELWPAFVEAGEAASFLDLLGADSGALPADAAATLAARQAAVEAATEEVSRRQAALAEAETAFRQLESGHRPELAGLHTDVAALQHRLSAWAQQEEELGRRREELTDLQRRLDFELDVVGVPDPAELARVGAAVAARDHLKSTRAAFDEKAAARQRAAETVDHQQAEVVAAEAAVTAWGTSFGEPAETFSSSDVRIKAERAAREVMLLTELGSELTELDSRRRDLAAAGGAVDRSVLLAPLAAEKAGVQPRVVLFAVAGLLLLGAGAGFALAGPVAGGLLAFMAVVVGGAAFVLGGGSGKAAESESREGIAAVLASLERRVRDRSQLLGFAEVPDVDEVAAQKATREQERVALSDLAADLLRFEQAKATAQANRQRLTELTRQHEQALTHWQAWLAQHQLPQVLRPEGVDEWLSHLDQARALQEQIQLSGRRERELAAALEDAPRSVSELVERAESASSDDSSVVNIARPSSNASIGELQTIVSSVAELVDEAVGAEREVSRVRDQLVALRAESERAVDQRVGASSELAGFLAAAGVLDARELQARLATDLRRGELSTIVTDFERQLQLASGREADADREALEARTPDEWHADAVKATGEAEELAAARDAALLRLGALEREVDAIESSGDLAQLALQREVLVEELRRVLHDWMVFHVAAGLIGHTLDKYLDERQPAVLHRAETHLATITDGRYKGIRLDPDATGRDPRLLVLDQGGSPRDPRELSRGTVEQVYMCLRLALAEQHRPSLPLLLDDILVNFDPARAEAATAVLAEVARTRQVLVFTCHPWVVDIVQSVEADSGVIELARIA